MGLLKAAAEAVSTTLHNQWLEALRSEDMGNNILMVKKTTENRIIPNGSKIIVQPGQVAVIYDTGEIIDAVAEPGYYEFNTDTAPSFFSGEFGTVFKEMWSRFKFDGQVSKEQAVYFFNVKEIIDNKFGTPNPVEYKEWGHPIYNEGTKSYMPMRVEIKCFGNYTFKIVNPALFMEMIGGPAEVYTKEMLTDQIRAEVIGAFSNVINSLGEEKYKVDVLSLPNQTDQIKKIMSEEDFDKPTRDRGIELIAFVIESLTLDDESKKKIDNYEMGADNQMQRGALTGAYAEAIKNAAENTSGALNGFVGMGMANMVAGGTLAGMATGVAGRTSNESTKTDDTWECKNCKIAVKGNFCSQCGEKKPE